MAAETIPATLSRVPRERWPRHIAIIMDGNGRWAQRRSLPRIEGHRSGVASVRAITEECARLHMEQLTLYCLSSENWKRPQQEIDFLMHLLEQYMIEERTTIMDNNLRVRMVGRRANIPEQVLKELDLTVDMSSQNSGMWLNLAINYGGRAELVDAMRRLGNRIADGHLHPEDINEQLIASHLYTADCEDPDLLYALRVRCVSAISYFGRSAMQRSGSPKNAGQNSTRQRSTRQFPTMPAANANSAA